MSFGKRLRMARKAAGFTQKALASLVGVSSSAIANYETGVSAPNEDILVNLMRELDIDANYLYADDLVKKEGIHYLAPDEERLISIYRDLNDQGRAMALTTIESFAGNPALIEEAATGAS